MFRRRHDETGQAERLDRALAESDLTPFDADTRELVNLSRALRPVEHQSERARQATYDRMMRAFAARNVTPRDAAGSQDPVDQRASPVTPAIVEHVYAGHVRIADVESVDEERAARVASQLAELREELARDATHTGR